MGDDLAAGAVGTVRAAEGRGEASAGAELGVPHQDRVRGGVDRMGGEHAASRGQTDLAGGRWRLCQSGQFDAKQRRITLVGRLRKDATQGLPETATGGKRGRKPKYGKEVVNLAKRAGHRAGWQQREMVLYGVKVMKTYKTFLATWRPAGGVIRIGRGERRQRLAGLFLHGSRGDGGGDSGNGCGSEQSGADVQGREGSVGSRAATTAKLMPNIELHSI